MVGKRYRIIETLGKGAFGTVYRAEVLGAGDFKKQVALKVLDYKGEAPDEIALRFRDEARILGLIRHRAVVGVDSLAELESGWAVVMEYVHGVNVSAVVKYGLPPARVVVAIVEEVASALHAAWTTVSDETGEPLRLVHRDIKPANVRLTAQGEVKVLDFGVARAEFESREAHTQAMRFGSLRYMAPEAFDGIEGHATDVFALGIVFGELLAGKRLEEPPKNPDRYPAFLEKIANAARARLEPTMDRAGLEKVIRLMNEMISFEPEDRPSARAVERTCRDLAGALVGPTMRDWCEDYIPALSEKIARRQAQKEAGDPPSSEILVEKSSGQVLEGSLPPQSAYPQVDGTETRANTTAIAGGAVFGAGVALAVVGALALALVGVGYMVLNPIEVTQGNDGVTDVNAPDPDKPEPKVQGDGTDLEVLEGLPKTEFFEVVDPDNPDRTIVIARGDVKGGEGSETISIVDPDDATRTIVIAKRSVKGRSTPPSDGGTDDEKVIAVPAPAPAPAPGPTSVQVPRPAPAPEPGPAPAPQPLASGGSVSLTGDAKTVSFVGEKGTFESGNMPVGTYRIMADFGNGAIQAGTVSVRDGEAVRVDCISLMQRCSRK